MLCNALEWWHGLGETQEGGDVCIHKADSLYCTAETNSVVKQLYFNNKIKFKNKKCN